MIVELGLCTRDRVLDAIEIAAASGTTADRVLLERGHISPEGVAVALAERHGLDYVDLSVFNVDMAAAHLVTSQVAKRHDALPIATAGDRALLVAMSDPANVHAVDDIAILTGYQIRVAVTTSEDIANVIARLARVGEVVHDQGEEVYAGGEAAVVDLHDTADDAPVVRLVHQLVGQAVDAGASDLHLTPDGENLRVRFRIDGVLRDVTSVPRRLAAGVISRMKIMAELDIAERRVPQDGRVGLTVDGHRIDLRIVTVPTVRGEGIVMRILDKEAIVMDLHRLAWRRAELARFKRSYSQSHGAVLVTGPTGSGKSTTLYAALENVNTPERHIITIEDPVEYQVEGITQIQVNTKAGLQFSDRAARAGACRPRRDHGGGDPRPRNRPDRDRGGADRPPRPLHAAHQRLRDLDHATDRDGHRAVPGCIGARLRRRAAARARAVSALQATASSCPRRRCASTATPRPTTSRASSRLAARTAAASATAGGPGSMR